MSTTTRNMRMYNLYLYRTKEEKKGGLVGRYKIIVEWPIPNASASVIRAMSRNFMRRKIDTSQLEIMVES
jgi:hypothetical protein